MAKDPAFLFYPQRWLEGTAEFSPAEKGVYIDLLAHQHQKGSLPSDMKRLCRLTSATESEFEVIWEAIKSKFTLILGNRLLNETLDEITSQRLAKGETNRITGRFATLIRQKKGLSENEREGIKNLFNVDDFKGIPDHILTVRITEWFEVAYQSIININGDINSSSKKGGTGENINSNFNTKPKAEDFNGLSDVMRGAVFQLIRITKKVELSPDDIDSLWDVFKIENLTGENFYQNESRVYSHFLNSVKFKNFDSNGQVIDKGSGTSRTITSLHAGSDWRK